MTDDTLRAECEKLGFDWLLTRKEIEELLAFARAQQAKGLREAAKLYRDWVAGKWFDAMEFQDALEAQARAQDQAQIQDLALWVTLGVTVTLCLLAWGM